MYDKERQHFSFYYGLWNRKYHFPEISQIFTLRKPRKPTKTKKSTYTVISVLDRLQLFLGALGFEKKKSLVLRPTILAHQKRKSNTYIEMQLGSKLDLQNLERRTLIDGNNLERNIFIYKASRG